MVAASFAILPVSCVVHQVCHACGILGMYRGAVVINATMRVVNERARVEAMQVLSWTFKLPRNHPCVLFTIECEHGVDVYICTPEGLAELEDHGHTMDAVYAICHSQTVEQCIHLPDDGPWCLVALNRNPFRVAVHIKAETVQEEFDLEDLHE